MEQNISKSVVPGIEFKKIYSLKFKHFICKKHKNEGIPLRQLVRDYGIGSHSCIFEWLRKLGYIYGDEGSGPSEHLVEIAFEMKKNKEMPLDTESLQQEIRKLKQQLKEAELRSEAYLRVIEIAETELNISITKKFNTK